MGAMRAAREDETGVNMLNYVRENDAMVRDLQDNGRGYYIIWKVQDQQLIEILYSCEANLRTCHLLLETNPDGIDFPVIDGELCPVVKCMSVHAAIALFKSNEEGAYRARNDWFISICNFLINQ
jgi:hypothetical protein